MYGYMSFAFVLWMATTFMVASVAFPVLPAVVGSALLLIAGSSFLGGGLATAIGGGIFSFICGAKAAARARVEEKRQQQMVYEKLTTPYKQTGMTKLEKFELLETFVNAKKARIETLRRDLTTEMRKELAENADKKIVLDYDLNQVDVYNDYYFEKDRKSVV